MAKTPIASPLTGGNPLRHSLAWQSPLAKYGLLAVAGCILPFFLGQYLIHVLIIAFLYCILVDSLNLIYGITGQLSLGQAAFYGLGAYTAGLLNVRLGLGFFPCLIAGAIVAGLGGALIGVPTLRLRSSYLIISTLCFGKIVTLVLLNWMDLTRGPLGLIGIAPARIGVPGLFMIEFSTKLSFYFLAFFFALASHLLIRQILRSRTGRSLLAIREDQLAAEALGVFVAKQKIMAFVLSAVLAGVAGVLYAFFVRCLSPEGFSIIESTEFLIFLVLGGVGNLWGPALGVLPAWLLLERLRFLGDWRLSIYGILLLVMTMFAPRGLAGLLDSAAAKVRALLEGARAGVSVGGGGGE